MVMELARISTTVSGVNVTLVILENNANSVSHMNASVTILPFCVVHIFVKNPPFNINISIFLKCVMIYFLRKTVRCRVRIEVYTTQPAHDVRTTL